jgi:type IV secretory pathway TraG/TraD family ATPase VirD4
MGAPTRAREQRRQSLPFRVMGAVVGVVVAGGALGLVLAGFFAAGSWQTPVAVGRALISRESEMTGGHVAGLLLGFAIAIVIAIVVVLLVRRANANVSWVDPAAPHMAAAKEIRSLGRKSAEKSAVRLGLDPKTFVGLPLGRHVGSGVWLYSTCEDVGLIFAGPRVGKSSSFGIPHLLAAPGPALATENKRTLHDATRGIREKLGRVFAFDPQGIVGEEPTWWWNPLSTIETEADAMELAELFSKAEMEAVSQTGGSDFFEQRASKLLQGLFLAAAKSGGRYYLRDVQAWLSDPNADEPVPIEILTGTVYREVVNELVGIYRSAPEEKSGVFSVAQIMTKSLSNRQIAVWVNPQPGDFAPRGRVHFDPALFLAGKNTLYSLSKDGSGSAKALVTALTVAVCNVAEKQAERMPGGRLAVPFVVVLDEAANVCRWPNLPKLYSHYGSRGILLVTILQSYPQGEAVWGKHGMDALLQAANWTVYGGGNKPGPLLSMLSDAIGEYFYMTPGSPGSKNSPRGPRQEHKDRVLDAAELSSLPRGRAVLLSSGNRAALIRTVPWMATEHRAEVEESLRRFDPAAAATLQNADKALHESTHNPSTARQVGV